MRLGSHVGRAARPMQLRMTPMIDVVFLLLIFFLLTANFRTREGFLPAELPRRVTRTQLGEIEPLAIRLESEGAVCRVQIGRTEVFAVNADDEGGFAVLTERLGAVLAAQRRHVEDPVKLAPAATTSWDHTVKAYDAIWALELRNIVFAMAG